jgi:hypothetical protein
MILLNETLVVRTLAIIRDLEEVLTFTPPIDPSTWELGSLPKLDRHHSRLWSINDIQQAGLEKYEAELSYWTRHMPPGLTRSYLDQVSRLTILQPIENIFPTDTFSYLFFSAPTQVTSQNCH